MQSSEVTDILVAIENLTGRITSLEQEVKKQQTSPIECSRLTFSLRQVIAIIITLGVLNMGSGLATYFGLSNLAKSGANWEYKTEDKNHGMR